MNPNELKPSMAYGKVNTQFPTIQDTPLKSLAQQTRVMPRQTATGVTRGEQTIKGTIAITDRNNTKRMIMGYKTGAF
jgi:hypothetical protein